MSRFRPSTMQPPVIRLAALAAFLATCAPAGAFTTTITAGSRMIYLQVGTGTVSGGNFNAGGTPQDNATVNSVAVTVPANAIGTGSRAMTTNSTTAQSPWDGFTFCTVPAQVYVGGFYRLPGTTGANATLTVTAPPNLVDADGDTIPFSTVSWASSGIGDAGTTIPAGVFSGLGTPQTLLSITRNTWFESCLAFSYANTAATPAGTFNGRAIYTLTAP